MSTKTDFILGFDFVYTENMQLSIGSDVMRMVCKMNIQTLNKKVHCNYKQFRTYFYVDFQGSRMSNSTYLSTDDTMT